MPRILRQPFQALIGRTGDSRGRSRDPPNAARLPGYGISNDGHRAVPNWLARAGARRDGERA
jgi:hypothetical protein